jgi:hypothetical protein
MTQAEIQLLIDQIVTGANYRANQLNPLLTDMLTASYGPMYIDDVPPTNSNDENQGYRLGSIGYDTLSQRFYICKNPAGGAAEWQLIPVDANYEWKSYAATQETISLGQNTSVFKAYNTDTAVNTKCSVVLPENPYTGKVVVLYFENEMEQFTIKDSDDVPIGAADILIPAGQQYTITYGGVAWEIVGVSNINPASLSGIDVNKGATSITNATAINFIGSSVAVAAGVGGSADVTINPISGVDIQRGGTLKKSDAQFINFNSYFFDVDPNSTGADVTFVQRITVTKDLTARSTTAIGFDFAGTLFDTVSMTGLTGNTATVTMNGANTLTLSGAISPAVTDDASDGYSRGSVAVNTGTLKRTYICTDNTTDAANWVRLTEDNGYQVQTATTSGQNYPLLRDTSSFLIIGANVSSMTLTLPSNQYNGKKIFISSQVSISGLVVNNFNGSTVMSSLNVSGSTTAPKLLIFVCVDSVAQTWARLQ